jgi:hypothetical protein
LVNEVIEDLKNFDFGLRIKNHLTDYLSCQIIANFENKTFFLMQPHLIESLELKFVDEIVKNLSNYGTPVTPWFKIVRPSKNVNKIYPNLQARHRSGVGYCCS